MPIGISNKSLVRRATKIDFRAADGKEVFDRGLHIINCQVERWRTLLITNHEKAQRSRADLDPVFARFAASAAEVPFIELGSLFDILSTDSQRDAVAQLPLHEHRVSERVGTINS